MNIDAAALQTLLNRMVSEDPNGADAERLLRRLTVFPGTFDASAAVALAPRDMPEVEVLAALVILQQWGLLGRVAQSEPLPIEARVLEAIPAHAETFATLQAWGFLERETIPARYFLLKLVLRTLPPDEDSRTRQYEYYRRTHGNLKVSIQHDRYPLIAADWLNIHAALMWGMSQASRSVPDFVWALNAFMHDCLAREDWRNLIEALLDSAQKYHNHAEQGNALTTLGTIAHLEGDLSRALNAYSDAFSCYEQVADTVRRIELLSIKVIEDLLELDARYETARDVQTHLLELTQAPRKTIQQIIVLYHLHDVQVKRDEFDDARESLLQIMAFYQQLRDEHGQCDTLTNLGATAALAGDLVQARDDFAWALRMAEGLSYPIGQMKTLWAWGRAEYTHGQIQAGCALCRQAIVVIIASPHLSDHTRADELRPQLAEMDCGTTAG